MSERSTSSATALRPNPGLRYGSTEASQCASSAGLAKATPRRSFTSPEPGTPLPPESHLARLDATCILCGGSATRGRRIRRVATEIAPAARRNRRGGLGRHRECPSQRGRAIVPCQLRHRRRATVAQGDRAQSQSGERTSRHRPLRSRHNHPSGGLPASPVQSAHLSATGSKGGWHVDFVSHFRGVRHAGKH